MPLPRSSIAAVILRREELALSEEQVQRLEQVQVELDQKDGTLRQGAGVAADPAGAERDHQNDGRRLGGRTGGAGGGRSHGAKAPRAPSASEVERALDDADTAAFLDAEKVLREDQQERARAIAEKFREDLYDAREQARRAGAQAPRS